MSEQCGQPVECYSRVCGYFRPVKNWNLGKKEEFKDRKLFEVNRRTIDKYYDPQMGVEIVTTEINGNANNRDITADSNTPGKHV